MRTSESELALPRAVQREGVGMAGGLPPARPARPFREPAPFTLTAEPVTFKYVHGSATGEAVDVNLEIDVLEAIFDDCRLAGPNDQDLRRRDQFRGVALLIIAEAYRTERPEGWHAPAVRAVELADGILREYGMRHAVDDLGDVYLCSGDRPMAWLGHAGRPMGGVVWSAGECPAAIDEFHAPSTVSQRMERAAFLDGLHRRAVSGSEPYLDAEQVALQRAAEWSTLVEAGLQRHVLRSEGVALLTFDGQPRTPIGRVGKPQGRVSLVDMTSVQRARWIGDLTQCLPESLGALEPLNIEFDRSPEGSPLCALLAEVAR